MDYRDSFIVPPRWTAAGSNRRWNRYERETAKDNVNIKAAVFMVEAGAIYYWCVMVEHNGMMVPGLCTFPWSTLWGACRCADRLIDDLFERKSMDGGGDGWAFQGIARWYSLRRGFGGEGRMETQFVQTGPDVVEYAAYLDGKLQQWGAEKSIADASNAVGIPFIRPIWRRITPQSYRLSVGFGPGRRLTVDVFERPDESFFWIICTDGCNTPYKQAEGTDLRTLTAAIERAEDEVALFIQTFADEQAASAATLSRRSIEQILGSGVATYER